MTEDTDLLRSDLAEVLAALGLGGHARPYSAHEVVQRDILPRVRALMAAEPRATVTYAPAPAGWYCTGCGQVRSPWDGKTRCGCGAVCAAWSPAVDVTLAYTPRCDHPMRERCPNA